MAGLGERPEGSFGLKKTQKEEKSAGQAKEKKKRVRSLTKGVDPPLICITEALLASAVSCRMITVLISADRGQKAGLASPNIVHLQKKIILRCVGYFFYMWNRLDHHY